MARNRTTGKTARKRGSGTPRKGRAGAQPRNLPRRILRWAGAGFLGAATVLLLLIALFRFVNPPATPYMLAESWRLNGVRQDWVALSRLPAHVPGAIVAAEDANFCLHWGFDMAAIRAAIAEGAGRGASTISQQVAKNLFLWQGRSWLRKMIEAPTTLAIEALWPKRRILEVYLNIAEFDRGVFGIEAAARRYFNRAAADLTPSQAARLAAVLPDPKGRSADDPRLSPRVRQIADGAATIAADGRNRCFR